ncbi:MAG: hypothetical protein EP347_10580 [Alphaproteobacteria bacterium]|nr:MAG: hypothetical protein EP347_10580 [Alphaproteobacteria bacterium]
MLITTTDLENWSRSRAAQQNLPGYIRELIVSSVEEANYLFIPEGDAVWLPGADGIVDVKSSSEFVPDGLSIWECGTNEDKAGKARDDFDKRSNLGEELAVAAKLPGELERSEVTFVFVTPHLWREKDQWIREQVAKNIWKDVRVIDGNRLANWFDLNPAVSLIVAAELGLVPPAGLQTVDQLWEEWSTQTNPAISEGLILAGRSSESQDLIRALQETANVLSIQGDSPNESLGFCIAALRTAEPEELRNSLVRRTVCAKNQEVAVQLSNSRKQIIVLKGTNGQVSNNHAIRGTHTVVPTGIESYGAKNTITLSRQNRRDFEDALRIGGETPEKASKLTAECNSHLTVFRRLNAHAGQVLPEWANVENAALICPALLAGHWDSKNSRDREILTTLFGRDEYSVVESNLQRYLSMDDAPIERVGSVWIVRSPLDCFQLMARFIDNTLVERFTKCFAEIFNSVDPRLDLPPNEWIFDTTSDQELGSGWLRKGLSNTLLLIAERGSSARMTVVPMGQELADQICSEIEFLQGGWSKLASIVDQSPNLMEASPDPLLDSLEALLEADPEGAAILFEEDSSGLGHGPLSTGLIWGLERTSWLSGYFNRSIQILAALAKGDPGGNWLNRPIHALREIFLSWGPGTNATAEQRISALQSLAFQEPQVCWQLLELVIPTGRNNISHATQKPKWKEFEDPDRSKFFNRDKWDYERQLLELALELRHESLSRWDVLLQALPYIAPETRKTVLSALSRDSEKLKSDDDIVTLKGTILDYIGLRGDNPREIAASGKETFDDLARIADKLTPNDLLIRSAWLFQEWIPIRFRMGGDWRTAEKELDLQRIETCRQILDQKGIAGIIGFAKKIKLQSHLATAAIKVNSSIQFAEELILASLEQSAQLQEFIGQLSRMAYLNEDDDWLKSLKKIVANHSDMSSEAFAWCLISLPPDLAIWSLARDMGSDVADYYWEHVYIHPLVSDAQERQFQIDQLLAHGRAPELLDFLPHLDADLGSDTYMKVFDTTFDELARTRSDEEVRKISHYLHNLKAFFEKFREMEGVEPIEIAKREYRALPVMGYIEFGKLTIHEMMANDPTFFVEILCDAFLPHNRDKEEEFNVGEEQQARASNAYKILSSMHIVPGTTKRGDISEEILEKWVSDVLDSAKHEDRSEVAELYVGHILAHAMDDKDDGAWPQKEIRNFIETHSTKNILQGINTERQNMRGVTWRDPYDGGTQERDLATQYDNWAEICKTEWPKTARLLRSIAESWRRDAKWHDDRATQTSIE